MGEAKRCEECRRPRDNDHSTLCPCCIQDLSGVQKMNTIREGKEVRQMSVTAKFKVLRTTPQDYGDGDSGAMVDLIPDYAHGRNKEWSKWTPSGHISMNIKNPVAEHFTPGRAFTVTFDPENY